MLTRGETDPSGEVPTLGEGFWWWRKSRQGCRGYRTDSWNRHQPHYCWIAGSSAPKLLFQRPNLFTQSQDLLYEDTRKLHHWTRQCIVGTLDHRDQTADVSGSGGSYNGHIRQGDRVGALMA